MINHSHPNREKIIISLKKARTSIEKILFTVDMKDPSCFPVIQQTLAVIGLLKSANTLMLESHFDSRIQDVSIRPSRKELDELKKEFLKIIRMIQTKQL